MCARTQAKGVCRVTAASRGDCFYKRMSNYVADLCKNSLWSQYTRERGMERTREPRGWTRKKEVVEGREHPLYKYRAGEWGSTASTSQTPPCTSRISFFGRLSSQNYPDRLHIFTQSHKFEFQIAPWLNYPAKSPLRGENHYVTRPVLTSLLPLISSEDCCVICCAQRVHSYLDFFHCCWILNWFLTSAVRDWLQSVYWFYSKLRLPQTHL